MIVAKNPNDLIRKDCYIVAPNGRIINAELLRTLKNYYKKNIYDSLHGQTVEKVVLIWSNNLDVIYPALLAIWELGMAISVHDFQLEIATHNSFKNFYKHIDLIIGMDPDYSKVLPEIPHVEALETVINYPSYVENLDSTIECLIDPIFANDQEYTLDREITNECIAVVGHTSGTTGDPKIIKTTRAQAFDIVKKNIEIFNFSKNDIVAHYKTLHHGALFLNYAVPAFATTMHHHWVLLKDNEKTVDFLNRILQKCHDDNITKWLVPYNWISSVKYCTEKNLSNLSLITVVGPSTEDMKLIFDKTNIKSVYNNFGCQEIGTLFVSCITNDSVNSYRPNFFTKINDLVDVEIQPRQFLVKFKDQSEFYTIGDVIVKHHSGIEWLGRNSIIVKNNIEINIHNVNQSLNKYFKHNNFVLVPDFHLNIMYLALIDYDGFGPDLMDQINNWLASDLDKNCNISQIDNVKFDKVVQGIKPSQPVLLYHFRNKNISVSEKPSRYHRI
jgi:hypothetical protein